MRTVAQQSAARVAEVGGLTLRLADVVITSGATLVAAYLVVAGRWVPGWWQSALVFAVIAVGPPVLRGLAARFPRVRLLDFAASFWLAPAATLGHSALGPLVDTVKPRLLDRYLAYADLRLFGEHPSIFLGRHVGPLATDLLLLCYYTYFLWPVLLAVLLYFRSPRPVFEQFQLALALCFTLNFFCYVMVPAVGPRFFLASSFAEPLKGLWLTPYLDSAMRGAPFLRDCFPSGHTAGTLLVLVFAFRHQRRLFWIMLPFAAGLITATLVGRFHYGIDLVFSVPLVVTVATASRSLCRAKPEGVVVPAAIPALREQIEA